MYRIWDNELKYYNTDIIVCQNGDLLELRKSKTFDGIFTREYTELKHVNKDSYIVQQCTGLKDKNGVLIYEGDEVSTKGLICKVVFESGMSIFCNRELEDGYILMYEYTDLDDVVDGEIIGNIMEDNNG